MNYNNPYRPYNFNPQYNPLQPYQDQLAQMQQQQAQVQQPTQSPQVNQGLLWVQGEAGAKSYLVAPNSSVLLMDSESEKFYIKSTDGAGMPNLRTFEYKEMTAAAVAPVQPNPDVQYVTKEEYSALESKYQELADSIAALKKPQTTARPKKEVVDNG